MENIERLMTNKYFSMALIAVIITLTATYYSTLKKKEGMQNVDLTPLAPELSEKPWGHHDGKYKRWNNKFDTFADAYVKNKLKKNGYTYTDFLGRSDNLYDKYMKTEGFEQSEGKVPEAANLRKEYMRCRPCDCEDEKN